MLPTKVTGSKQDFHARLKGLRGRKTFFKTTLTYALDILQKANKGPLDCGIEIVIRFWFALISVKPHMKEAYMMTF